MSTTAGSPDVPDRPIFDLNVPAEPIFEPQTDSPPTADGDGPAPQRPTDLKGELGRFLLYGVSLPERAVRSTVAVAAGAATEAAQVLVPRSFHESKSYELLVKNSLRFLTDDVGGVAREPDEGKSPDDFLARKAVGNFIDIAGLATLHVSPVWFMAIVSDVAYGTQSYVAELAEELKKQGLIDEASTINHVDDVLSAVRNTSGEAASLFDRPPLSVEQLKQSLESTRAAITSADYRRVLPEAELYKYWSEMREIARRENVSLLGVSGAVTMHTLGKVSTVSSGALTGVQVVGGLFSRHVVRHYASALQEVREQGFYNFVRESSQPYIAAVWSNFAGDKETWTEQLVTGKLLGKTVKTVGGWFGPDRKIGEEIETALPEPPAAPQLPQSDN